MSVPNHAQIVRDVAAAHPELLTPNTSASCAEFLQWVIAALPRNEPWGYVSKSSGENGYTFPNGVRVAIGNRSGGRAPDRPASLSAGQCVG